MELYVNDEKLQLHLTDTTKFHIKELEKYTYQINLKLNKMKYEITEEQIKELAKGNAKVKKWFPEVFEIDFLNKWQTPLNGYEGIALLFRTNKDVFNAGYGFDYKGDWVNKRYSICAKPDNFRLATDSEVLEALTNEFKKQNPKVKLISAWFVKDENILTARIDNEVMDLFNNGIWTKFHTKEEAEKLLNAKIV